MKVSLRWIADYLSIDWKKIPVAQFVELFNTKVAEIEEYQKFVLDLSSFFVAQVTQVTGDTVNVHILENKKDIQLPLRSNLAVGQWYVITRSGDTYRWASCKDFNTDQEELLPEVACSKDVAMGSWRDAIEEEDYILDIDNKSITHRPDLWGHYGIARECALLLDVTLKSMPLASNIKILHDKKSYTATQDFPINIAIKTEKCSYFSALIIDKIENALPLNMHMSVRLLRLGQRAINGIVDLTNYVMLDCGQPLHAFDADAFTQKKIEPRQAKKDEELVLLNNTPTLLFEEDIVISDGKKPVALAGIKGGKNSRVTAVTKKIVVEAATFDAATIRLSSARHGIRTQASARFEKTLDTHATIIALQRFLYCLQNNNALVEPSLLVALGVHTDPLVLPIEHDFLEKRLGVELSHTWIIDTLSRLGFTVVNKQKVYSVTVPTYRATKDIRIKEDIVEEIGRFYGYTRIPLVMPHIEQTHVRGYNQKKEELIKSFLSSVAHMREVRNYAFFDNDFLKKIHWNLNDSVMLENPLSEQRTTLVTSLIPGLLQNIYQNYSSHDRLRFFEWGRVWSYNTQEKQAIIESTVLSGVFYQKKEQIDFYDIKSYLEQLFFELEISVVWSPACVLKQWNTKYQTADILVNDICIGKLARVNRYMMSVFDGADAYAFELFIDKIFDCPIQEKTFKSLPKYQASTFDISLFVDQSVLFTTLEQAVKNADNRIFLVELQDVFIKPEWKDKKSITIRYHARDEERTLQKQDLEVVQANVKKSVESYGAEVR